MPQTNLEAVAKAIQPKKTLLNYVELALAYAFLFALMFTMAAAIVFIITL